MAKDTKFKKGVSGNPAGRKPGIHTKYAKYRNLIDKHAPEIIQMLIDKAVNDGDVTAARVLLDRIYPADAERELDLREEMKAIMERLDQLESK